MRPQIPLSTMTKLVLTIWVVLLIPWLPLAGFAGLAFDGATTPGRTVVAWIFVLLIWTYPVPVWLAFAYRKERPRLVWLPLINIAPFVLALLAAAFD